MSRTATVLATSAAVLLALSFSATAQAESGSVLEASADGSSSVLEEASTATPTEASEPAPETDCDPVACTGGSDDGASEPATTEDATAGAVAPPAPAETTPPAGTDAETPVASSEPPIESTPPVEAPPAPTEPEAAPVESSAPAEPTTPVELVAGGETPIEAVPPSDPASSAADQRPSIVVIAAPSPLPPLAFLGAPELAVPGIKPSPSASARTGGPRGGDLSKAPPVSARPALDGLIPRSPTTPAPSPVTGALSLSAAGTGTAFSNALAALVAALTVGVAYRLTRRLVPLVAVWRPAAPVFPLERPG